MPDAPDPKLIDLLADRDVPCPGCGYNLRGLTTDRCPECNQQLELQVKLTEPKLAAFIAGLVGISMGLGFCALLSGWAIWIIIITRQSSRWPDKFWVVLLGLTLSAALATLWIMIRKRLTRMTPALRWAATIAVAILSLLLPVIFIMTNK